MNVLVISLTEDGRRLAARLPFSHVHGELASTVARSWPQVDGFVLIASVGIATRVIAPLLADKHTDPAVVCVDDSGRFAVAVTGGHAAGANDLTRTVAELLGAEPVITTATDRRQVPALDQLPGLIARGPIATATRRLLDGAGLDIETRLPWPVPLALAERAGATGSTDSAANDEPVRVVIDDRRGDESAVVLHPPSLVLGVGCSTDATAEDARAAVDDVLQRAGLAPESVALVATIDRRAEHPALLAVADHGGLQTFSASALASVTVPNPSEVVAAEVGTPSVCEAAALLAAGPGADLVVEKHRSERVTVAVARRAQPPGQLTVVGLGPGAAEHRTPTAARAVRQAEVIVGFGDYIDLCRDLVTAAHHVVRSPIGDEVARTDVALRHAAEGRSVVLVCSGDAGVYALATLAFERAEHHGVDPSAIVVVPGVTAALTAAALLGAPLAHDHVAISLSDLLTPWADIEARVRAAAEADLVVSFYNPRSQRRTWQLDKACALLAEHRPSTTPVGVVTSAGRAGQRVTVTSLAELDPTIVDMVSIVVVGSSRTRMIGGRMVTPRGYAS